MRHCETISLGVTPGGPATRTHTTGRTPFAHCFGNTFPRPASCRTDFPCKLDHPYLAIPSAAVVVRSGPASPRIAAGSDALPPTAASSNVYQVPVPQRFGIMSSEEQPSDSGYFFHFRSSRFMFSSCLRRRSRTPWICGVLCRHGEFIPGQNEVLTRKHTTGFEVTGAFQSSFHPPNETLCESSYDTCADRVLKV